MMRPVFFAAAATLALAACGESEPEAAFVENEAVTENAAAVNYQQAVADLTDPERNIVMIRALRDAGIDCQSVTGSERMEDWTWRATCSDDSSHLVEIGADGNATVVSAVRPTL